MGRIDNSKFLEKSKRKRPTNSPGYEQVPESQRTFDCKNRYTIDYSDYEISRKKLNELLSDQVYKLNAFTKRYGLKMQGAGKGTFFMEISPGLDRASNKRDKNRDYIVKAPPMGYEISTAIQGEVQELGKIGRDIMRKYVNRIETGLMKKEIRYEARKRKDYTTLEIGWIRDWYKYFGFQENGFYISPTKRYQRNTKLHPKGGFRKGGFRGAVTTGEYHKVPGMKSLFRTRLEFRPIFQRRINAAIRRLFLR